MLSHSEDLQLTRVSKMFLTYAAAFAPDRWLLRTLIEDAPFATIKAVAPYCTRAIQLLFDQQLLISHQDTRFVFVPRHARTYVRMTLPAGVELSSFYNGIEAVIYQALDEGAEYRPLIEQEVLLNQAKAIADRSIRRGSTLAYELSYLVGRTALLLDDDDAEHFLREALRLELTEQHEDAIVADGTLQIAIAFYVKIIRPGFTQTYLSQLLERCKQRFGAKHNITTEVASILEDICASPNNN